MLDSTQLPESLSFTMGDVTGQRRIRISDLPAGMTIGELIADVIEPMGLPRNDSEGRPLVYKARSNRVGRHLGANETVGDCVENDDELSMHPNVDAGVPL